MRRIVKNTVAYCQTAGSLNIHALEVIGEIAVGDFDILKILAVRHHPYCSISISRHPAFIALECTADKMQPIDGSIAATAVIIAYGNIVLYGPTVKRYIGKQAFGMIASGSPWQSFFYDIIICGGTCLLYTSRCV